MDSRFIILWVKILGLEIFGWWVILGVMLQNLQGGSPDVFVEFHGAGLLSFFYMEI